MTPNQRALFFGTLWPAACAAQGWDPKDDHARKRVVVAATGEESMSGLDQDQITLLFAKVRHLADPANFDKALADSDPQATLAEHKRAQIIWRIRHTASLAGLDEPWIITTAEGKCRANNVLNWTNLPTSELLKLSATVESRTSALAREARAQRAAKKAAKSPHAPRVQAPGHDASALPF